MGNIISYAREAQDTFAERPFCRVDALCLAWLAYLRLPQELGVGTRAGVRLVDLCDERLIPAMTSSLHDAESSRELLVAMAASPRFANVRACLHVAETDESEAMQFAATTFVLPEGAGSCITLRGTDNTLLGWKENMHFVCMRAIPAQRRAVAYVEQTVEELGGTIWVSGHSKGGALGVYACGMAREEIQAQIDCCYCFDGPGMSPQVRKDASWHDGVVVIKVVPRASLVGMLFERSQQELVVVSSSAEGVMQHAPFSWEVRGGDFVGVQGLDYDAWKLSQRVNDWLEAMAPAEREDFSGLLSWLIDVTGEPSFSALLRRWSLNAKAMRAALEAAPAGDRELFGRVMDDLVATVLLGSRRELGLEDDDTPKGSAGAAARKLEDLTAKVNDRLSKLDRLTGR